MKPVPNTCPKIQHSCHSLFLAGQHNAKRWKSILALVGILAASIGSAPAASIIVNAVGTVNENGKTILEATGNSMNATAFASVISTAYANDTGGVWNFDTPGGFGTVNVGETVTLNYGASQANSVILGLSSGNNINQGTIAGEATSGSAELGLGGDASTRVFTLSTLMSTIGIFNLDRNDASRTSVLSVTFLDDTTASTSGADGDNTYFHILSATGTNYIKSFSLTQNNFIRYDDLGFVVASSAPEPSRALLLMLGATGLLVRRRRQSVPVLSSVISA